jgi:hypothetical protein
VGWGVGGRNVGMKGSNFLTICSWRLLLSSRGSERQTEGFQRLQHELGDADALKDVFSGCSPNVSKG